MRRQQPGGAPGETTHPTGPHGAAASGPQETNEAGGKPPRGRPEPLAACKFPRGPRRAPVSLLVAKEGSGEAEASLQNHEPDLPVRGPVDGGGTAEEGARHAGALRSPASSEERAGHAAGRTCWLPFTRGVRDRHTLAPADQPNASCWEEGRGDRARGWRRGVREHRLRACGTPGGASSTSVNKNSHTNWLCAPSPPTRRACSTAPNSGWSSTASLTR